MSSVVDKLAVDKVEIEPETSADVIPLTDFIRDFGDGLLEAVQQQNPPLYDGHPDLMRDQVMDALTRAPFPAQRDAVQALCKLLVEQNEPAAILNAEMGTGKTMMAIATATVLEAEGYVRTVVISPPHLVYKWRREILETVDNARVWVLNGPDTLAKLLLIKESLGAQEHEGPEFFVLGRVRMRMGFHWKPAYTIRLRYGRVCSTDNDSITYVQKEAYCACPKCGSLVLTKGEDGRWDNPVKPGLFPANIRLKCRAEVDGKDCGEPLWTLMRPEKRQKSRRDLVLEAMCQIPTIGPKTADRLVSVFGEELLQGMLADNVYSFINLMDEDGELVFSDKQARRMERAMANLEFGFGQGGYQATEFIKRYLPNGYFSNLIVDEGHEYKNDASAQGQAMGVLANKVRKILLLTGTLMGGYADDLFYLLWRIMPQRMIEDGFVYNSRGSLGTASMSFMREYGILKDIYTESEGDSHRTAKGKRITVRTAKGPGFGPKGIARYVLPYTVFLKLRDIGGNVLPAYDEHFIDVVMTDDQAEKYKAMESALTAELKEALRKGDNSLLGVVLNTLLAWPSTCFRQEVVKHPRTRELLFYSPSMFVDDELMPAEEELLRICNENKARGRRVLAYTVYSGRRDTTVRLKSLLQHAGLKVAVLRASVDTSKREDWILDQVDRGIDVLICNPELVKTGLDLLDFPSIVFMQTGYNVYTLQQAARRSWRIGQKEDVEVYYLGYEETAQIACLSLMARKIAVSQSTSGDMPDSGLDVLNQDGDSIEVELAKQLLAA
ncbi:MAG: SNF2-related protein [Candidatus Thiodiazotropha endolucinida]